MIVECDAMGKSAHETVEYVKKHGDMEIHYQTVYAHRKSMRAAEVINEILRQQKRDIAEAEIETRLKYRDKLLDKLLPQLKLIMQKNITQSEVKIDFEKLQDNIKKAVMRNYIRESADSKREDYSDTG
jgi:hypothetical protein